MLLNISISSLMFSFISYFYCLEINIKNNWLKKRYSDKVVLEKEQQNIKIYPWKTSDITKGIILMMNWHYTPDVSYPFSRNLQIFIFAHRFAKCLKLCITMSFIFSVYNSWTPKQFFGFFFCRMLRITSPTPITTNNTRTILRCR